VVHSGSQTRQGTGSLHTVAIEAAAEAEEFEVSYHDRISGPMRDDNTCLPAIEMTEFVLTGVG